MALIVTPAEIIIFNRIRNINDQPQGQERQNEINSINIEIQNLIPEYNTITENSEFKHQNSYFNDEGVYILEFKNIIQQTDTIIFTYDDDENVKYTNIGKAFFNISCNNNNYNLRFIKHIINLNKVKVWNKQILLLKLQRTMIKLINNIGNCDYNILSRNMSSSVKYSSGKVFNKVMNASERFILGDASDAVDDETEYDATKLEAVNMVRSRLILLKSFYDQNIVTSKELEINVKMNKPYWLENPAIIASMTAVTNTFLSLSTFQARLTETPFVSKLTSSINKSFIPALLHSLPITAVVVAGMLSGLLVPVASLGILALGTYVSKKINESDYVKIKNRNKELNLQTIEITNEFKKENLIPETDGRNRLPLSCAISGSAGEYYTRFERALELEDNYFNESTQNYDTIVTLSYNYVNIYSIICQNVFQPQPIDQAAQQAPIDQAAAPIDQVAAPIDQAAAPIDQAAAPIVEGQNVEGQNQVAPPIAQNQGPAEVLEAQRINILQRLEELWGRTNSGRNKAAITNDELRQVADQVRPFIKAKLNLVGDCNINTISKTNFTQFLNDFRINKAYDNSKKTLCGLKAVGGKTKRSRKGKTKKRTRKGKTKKRR
jgi:hypothetical protein